MELLDVQRFTWVAEHLKSFAMGLYRGGHIVWIDDNGVERVTTASVSDDLNATDVAILRACVDKAIKGE